MLSIGSSIRSGTCVDLAILRGLEAGGDAVTSTPASGDWAALAGTTATRLDLCGRAGGTSN